MWDPYELETIVRRITKHEENSAKNLTSLKRKLKMARRPMKMIVTKEVVKFMPSDTYIDVMGEQYNQGYQLGLCEGFTINRHYAMKVDVDGKWVTVNYYKALAFRATR